MNGAIARAAGAGRRRRPAPGCRSSSRTRPTSTSTCAPPPQEIAADFPSGIDALITGVGTGGHITGCAQVLKKMWPKLQVYAVEPSASPVISGGKPSPHPIQGIGAGFIPKNLHVDLLDGVIQVEAEAAREMARRCAARGRPAGRHLVGRDAGGDRPEAARHRRPARPCSASTTTPASATSRSKASCRGMRAANRILIVEDEPGIADTLQYALRTDGFEPAWCATGEEALARIASDRAGAGDPRRRPARRERLRDLQADPRDQRGAGRLPHRAQRRDRPRRRPRARRRRLRRQAVLAARAGGAGAQRAAPQPASGATAAPAGSRAERRAGAADRRRRRTHADPLLRPRCSSSRATSTAC